MTQDQEESQHERTGEYKPFDDDPSLKLDGSAGSIKYFHSTAGRYEFIPLATLPVAPSLSNEHVELTDSSTTHSSAEKTASRQNSVQDHDVSYLWRPRDNRKGRHALLLRRGLTDDDSEDAYEFIKFTNSPGAILHGLKVMATMFPYWDISWLLAIMFTLGSLLWIANGCLVYLPLIDPKLQVSKHATTWSAFAASTIYLLASILLMLEAINAYKSGCFGWIIERDAGAPLSQTRARPGGCHHRHHLQYKGDQPLDRQSSKNQIERLDRKEQNLHAHYWEWWPSWEDLRSHYFYELGFIACAVQLVSVILFWLAKFIAIPEVSSRLSVAAMDGAYWAPEILACIGFIASCSLIMIETQSRWYIPAVAILGWHVGFWKLIGSIGFMVSAALGPLSQESYPYAEYHSNLASFWGSCALLVGSLVQWYESLDKNPVVREGSSAFSEYNERWFQDDDGVVDEKNTRGDA